MLCCVALCAVCCAVCYVLCARDQTPRFPIRFVPNPRPDRAEIFPFEMYADLTELKALCTLIGPSGVRRFDRTILNAVAIHTETLKEILRVNEPVLKTLVRSEGVMVVIVIVIVIVIMV